MANNIFQLFGEMKENPYLGEYIKEGLLNKLPFVNRDKQEDRAYLGARGYGIGQFMDRPELPELMQSEYDNDYYTADSILNDALRGPNYRTYPDSGFPQPQPQVLGASNSGYGIEQPVEQTGYSNYLDLPQLQGKTPIEDIVVTPEVIDTFVNNAGRWAGTTQPNAQKYPYRQPDTVAENAEYVKEYVRAIMEMAPYFNLPPKTLAAMIMEESGWGGQRFDGNLGGYGFLDSGEDMGIRFEAPTVQEQAAKYLEKVSSDWGGRYQGARSPQDFHERGYNPHAEYPGRVMGVYNMLAAGL